MPQSTHAMPPSRKPAHGRCGSLSAPFAIGAFGSLACSARPAATSALVAHSQQITKIALCFHPHLVTAGSRSLVSEIYGVGFETV